MLTQKRHKYFSQMMILSRRMFNTLPVAVRNINRVLSAKSTQGHMRCRAVGGRGSQAAERLCSQRKTMILCLLWAGLLWSSLCFSHQWKRCQPSFLSAIQQQEERKRFTALHTSTLAIHLNLLLRCDSGKGQAEMRWVLGFRIRARRPCLISFRPGNGLHLSAAEDHTVSSSSP